VKCWNGDDDDKDRRAVDSHKLDALYYKSVFAISANELASEFVCIIV
jgi:hypothetical protein